MSHTDMAANKEASGHWEALAAGGTRLTRTRTLSEGTSADYIHTCMFTASHKGRLTTDLSRFKAGLVDRRH